VTIDRQQALLVGLGSVAVAAIPVAFLYYGCLRVAFQRSFDGRWKKAAGIAIKLGALGLLLAGSKAGNEVLSAHFIPKAANPDKLYEAIVLMILFGTITAVAGAYLHLQLDGRKPKEGDAADNFYKFLVILAALCGLLSSDYKDSLHKRDAILAERASLPTYDPSVPLNQRMLYTLELANGSSFRLTGPSGLSLDDLWNFVARGWPETRTPHKTREELRKACKILWDGVNVRRIAVEEMPLAYESSITRVPEFGDVVTLFVPQGTDNQELWLRIGKSKAGQISKACRSDFGAR
jgi:hypothetical protein